MSVQFTETYVPICQFLSRWSGFQMIFLYIFCKFFCIFFCKLSIYIILHMLHICLLIYLHILHIWKCSHCCTFDIVFCYIFICILHSAYLFCILSAYALTYIDAYHVYYAYSWLFYIFCIFCTMTHWHDSSCHCCCSVPVRQKNEQHSKEASRGREQCRKQQETGQNQQNVEHSAALWQSM